MAATAQQVERKFLVNQLPEGLGIREVQDPLAVDTSLGGITSYVDILQGYMAIEADGVEVSLRWEQSTGFDDRPPNVYTQIVKPADRVMHSDVEVELAPLEFDKLWPLTNKGRRLSKRRLSLPHEASVIELDVYRGRRLKGLVVAEVEFLDELTATGFVMPEWFGVEVTKEKEFKDRQLAVDGLPPTSCGYYETWWLEGSETPPEQVTKSKWVSAERAAGFRNTMGKPDEPATGSFSGEGIRGFTRSSPLVHDTAYLLG